MFHVVFCLIVYRLCLPDKYLPWSYLEDMAEKTYQVFRTNKKYCGRTYMLCCGVVCVCVYVCVLCCVSVRACVRACMCVRVCVYVLMGGRGGGYSVCLYVVCVICLYVRTRARVCVCVLIKSVCASLRVFANMCKITCVRKRDKQTEKKREEGRGGGGSFRLGGGHCL